MESSRSRHGVDVLRGWADSIDFLNKTVTVEGAVEKRPMNRDAGGKEGGGGVVGGGPGSRFEVKFDKIVIGVGAYSQTFGVPGVKEHAFFLKDVADARKIRKRILECMYAHDTDSNSADIRAEQVLKKPHYQRPRKHGRNNSSTSPLSEAVVSPRPPPAQSVNKSFTHPLRNTNSNRH